MPQTPPQKNSPAPIEVTMENRHEIRDFILWETHEEGNDEAIRQSLCFSGRPVGQLIGDSDLGDWLDELRTHISKHHRRVNQFQVDFKQEIFRGRRIKRTANGHSMLFLRRVAPDVPLLKDLKLPKLWRDAFMQPSLHSGGLILMVAATGQGKTTTMGAIIRSRLELFGGYAMTVEDPCELPLFGWHGDGFCMQTVVKDDQYGPALSECLQTAPTLPGGGTMCLVGEVKDPETASKLLQQSESGHLMLATVHGRDIQAALTRLHTLASTVLGADTAAELLGSSLRVAVHQTLRFPKSRTSDDMFSADLSGQILVSPGGLCNVRNKIAGKEFAAIPGIVKEQEKLTESSPNFSEFLKRITG